MSFFNFLFPKKRSKELSPQEKFTEAYSKGDYRKAVELSKDVDIGDDPVLCQHIAVSYFQIQQWEASGRYYKMIHHLVKENKEYWDDIINEALCKISFKLEDYEDTIHRIQSLDKEGIKDMNKYEDYQYAYMLGFSFQQLGLYKQAIESYKGGKLSEQYPSSNQVNMIRHTAECYEAMGNKKQAINFYEKFLSKKFDKKIMEKINLLNE